jgi:hypothetical protein
MSLPSGNKIGGRKFVFTLALTLNPLPQERNHHWPILVLWTTVRQIQSREFSEKRRTILLPLGEKAGMREVTVQAGQINERGQRSFAVDAQLKFFCHCYGDYL